MAARMMWGVAGLVILGIILLAVGAIIEPSRDKIGTPTPSDPGKIPENAAVTQGGESLIAFGLTLILVGIGFSLASMTPLSPSPRPRE